jgi:hypothetical protein
MASQVDPENPDAEANEGRSPRGIYDIGEQMGLLDPEDGDDDGGIEQFADDG